MYKCCTRAQYETLFSSCFWRTIIGGLPLVSLSSQLVVSNEEDFERFFSQFWRETETTT